MRNTLDTAGVEFGGVGWATVVVGAGEDIGFLVSLKANSLFLEL